MVGDIIDEYIYDNGNYNDNCTYNCKYNCNEVQVAQVDIPISPEFILNQKNWTKTFDQFFYDFWYNLIIIIIK